MDATRAETIGALNDALRTTFRGGLVLTTVGIQALLPDLRQAVYRAVQGFDRFTPDDDPRGEHDFGALTVEGRAIVWTIDCYDADMQQASSDPTDPARTTRVLTILLAEEY